MEAASHDSGTIYLFNIIFSPSAFRTHLYLRFILVLDALPRVTVIFVEQIPEHSIGKFNFQKGL